MRPLSGARVHLYANHVAGGWRAQDLETGLGGSEEVLALWSRELARQGAEVQLYRNAPPGCAEEEVVDGVRYLPRERFDPRAERDALVTWKDPRPWLLGAKAGRRIHWSSDVETRWSTGTLEGLHAFVFLSRYHGRRMRWVPPAIAWNVPHGIDVAALNAARCERVPGRALYASSPDRGLERLLQDWPRLRERYDLELHVTYGWRQFDACAAESHPSPRAQILQTRRRIDRALAQPGVVVHGALPRAEMAALYWQAEFWFLPLVRADAELFCLNALKARHTRMLPVVRRRGALVDTVATWLDYEQVVAAPAGQKHELQFTRSEQLPVLDWERVVTHYWIPLLKGTL